MDLYAFSCWSGFEINTPKSTKLRKVNPTDGCLKLESFFFLYYFHLLEYIDLHLC